MVGDFKKMFNQVLIAVHYRTYHGFLWRKGDLSQPSKDYQWKRLLLSEKTAPDLLNTFSRRENFLLKADIQITSLSTNLLRKRYRCFGSPMEKTARRHSNQNSSVSFFRKLFPNLLTGMRESIL